MREDQTQLFKTDYGTRCDTFGCGEAGAYFVGRPDGPLNTSHILCQTCTDNLVESIGKLFAQEKTTKPTISEEIVVEERASLEDRLIFAKTHAELDDIVEELALKGIPNRENAKLQERKDLIAAAVK